MKEYKVVPCPARVVAKKETAAGKEIAEFANIIAQECIGGWELVGVMPITVSTSKKRFKGANTPYNALVFKRDVDELPPEEEYYDYVDDVSSVEDDAD